MSWAGLIYVNEVQRGGAGPIYTNEAPSQRAVLIGGKFTQW